MESELTKAKKHFEKGENFQALAILDKLIKNSNSMNVQHLRALIRENINDLSGSLSDLGAENPSWDHALTKARILAKLGFSEEAISTLRKILRRTNKRNYDYWVSLGIGIAGRRFDLELLGFNPEQKSLPTNLNKWMKGCIQEHLIALGEFAVCRRVFGENRDGEFSLLTISRNIEKVDELRPLITDDVIVAQVQRAVKGIRGWLSLDEAKLLAVLASKIPSEYDIVEIGSFQGRSTCALAVGLKMGRCKRIHAIDTHRGLPGIFPETTLPILQANLRSKHFTKNVTIHLGTSEDNARSWRGKSIGLLFVDGDHSYESVKCDYEAWLPHLAPGGFIAFHDSNQPGPNRLLCEIIRNDSNNIHPIGLRDSLAILQLSQTGSITTQKNPEKIWLEYFTILGQNYSAWINQEKMRLNRFTLDLFEQIECKLSVYETFLKDSTSLPKQTYLCTLRDKPKSESGHSI